MSGRLRQNAPFEAAGVINHRGSRRGSNDSLASSLRGIYYAPKEMKMRVIACVLLITGLSAAVPTYAGSSGNAYNVSQEKGVTVYRGQPSAETYRAHAALQQAHKSRKAKSAIKAEFAAQRRAIRAQTKAVQSLERKVDRLADRQQESRKRPRYGRSYYGNPRFFGPNGFVGNRNFSGATVPTHRPRPRPRRRYHR